MFPLGVAGNGVDMSNTAGVPVGWCEEGVGKRGWFLETETQNGDANGHANFAGDMGTVAANYGTEKTRHMWQEFKKAEYVEGILEPGDGLFIPVGWWHYVRSLDVSFSVSFWWK